MTFMKLVVAGLITRQRGEGMEILACQRSASDPMPLRWEFPGGKIENAEEPHTALQRELKEELDIDAIIGKELMRTRYLCPSGVEVDLRFFAITSFTGEV